MRYYYNQQSFYGITNLKKLKEKLKEDYSLSAIKDKLSKITNKELHLYWTTRSTFGFVFCDFEWEHNKYERLIGKGEKDLFKKLENEYDYILFSKIIDRNFLTGKVSDKNFIIINISNFKEFVNTIRDKSYTIPLFLYKFKDKEQENLVRAWIKNSPDIQDIKEEENLEANIDAILDTIKKFKIDTAADLERVLTFQKNYVNNIINNGGYFRKQLKEFKELIEKNADEYKLHNFIFNNIWLLDFKYNGLYSKEDEKRIEEGRIDIRVYKNNIGFDRDLIIELKRADEKIVDERYRKTEVITSAVGKAISQVINYLIGLEEKESNDGKLHVLNGLVIIGKEDNTGQRRLVIEKFKKYLHNISIKTYDELYEDALAVVETFESVPDTKEQT